MGCLFQHRCVHSDEGGRMAGTLRPEGFATQVALVGPLATVYTQMHVQVVLL